MLVQNSDYALPIPAPLLSAHPSWLGAEVATATTPTSAQVAPVSPAGPTATVGSTSDPAAPAASAPQGAAGTSASTGSAGASAAGKTTPEAKTPATPPAAPISPAKAAAPVDLPVPSGTAVTAVTGGKIVAVTPTPPPKPAAGAAPDSVVGPVPVTDTVTLVGTDGATYTYTGVVGSRPAGTPTTPGAKIGTASPTGITFGIQVPDVVGQVCATSALEAWSVGTPLDIRSLPTTCLPGDLSALTDGTLGGAHQNVLVVTNGAAGNAGTDVKTLLTGSQITSSTLDLDQTESPAQQAATIAQASVITPAVAAKPATPATATSPAKPATPAVPAVTSNLVVIALGSDDPAAAAALTAKLPSTQQVLWVVPPLPNDSPAPPAGTPSMASKYASFLTTHPNVRVDWVSASLALLTTGSVNAPASTWSAVGAQVVASNVAGYAATAYRLPTTNTAAATVVSFAESQLGKPYQWGGAGPASYDCSGLTMAAFAQVGINLAHNANDQYVATSVQAVSEADLQPGDLVFFVGSDGTSTAPGHVGLYVGNGEYIDAPDSGGVVRFDTLAPGDGYIGASNPLSTISLGPATTTSSGAALVDSAGAGAVANQALGRALVDATWNDSQWVYLDELWVRESGWNAHAINPTSGAYGIPQSLPAGKMGAVASDWATDPTTQILWGIEYIQATYGSPEAAWAHEVAYNWY